MRMFLLIAIAMCSIAGTANSCVVKFSEDLSALKVLEQEVQQSSNGERLIYTHMCSRNHEDVYVYIVFDQFNYPKEAWLKVSNGEFASLGKADDIRREMSKYNGLVTAHQWLSTGKGVLLQYRLSDSLDEDVQIFFHQ